MKRAIIAASLCALGTLATAAPVTYTIDPGHSTVVAESRHFGTSTMRTRFVARSGTITIDPVAKTGSATIDIDLTSAQSGVAALDSQLKSDKFFATADDPDGVFTATRFTFDGDRIAQIVGDLKMHGRTGPVTLVATNYNCYFSPTFRRQVCGGDFEATIQRSVWNINYLIPFVSDETRLKIQIEATKD